MKDGYCEHCSPVVNDCIVCDAFARWADDGGPAFDYDGDTIPADTVRISGALTRTDLRPDLRPVVTPWHQTVALAWAVMFVCLAWAGVLVWFFGFIYRK